MVRQGGVGWVWERGKGNGEGVGEVGGRRYRRDNKLQAQVDDIFPPSNHCYG